MKVELDCDYGVTVLQSCYASKELVDTCKINSAFSNQNSNAITRCQVSVTWLIFIEQRDENLKYIDCLAGHKQLYSHSYSVQMFIIDYLFFLTKSLY